jgi:hypothetical protein
MVVRQDKRTANGQSYKRVQARQKLGGAVKHAAQFGEARLWR